MSVVDWDSEMSSRVSPTARFEAVARATSPSERMPTRSSPFSTGSRLTRCSAMRSRASDSCVSGVTVAGDLVRMSLSLTSSGSRREATTRRTTSRSVTRPTSLPSSTTGTTPMSNCFMRPAASAAVMSGFAV